MRNLILCWGLLLPTFALSAPMPSGDFMEAELRLRLIPTGLGVAASVGRRAPFYQSDHLALEHNGLAYGAYVQASPVSFHPGLFVRVIPLTVLELEFGVQALSYFGALNSVLRYESENGDWSQAGQKARRSVAEIKPGYGWSGFGIARLKL